MVKSLGGKKALVTGAASGIGKAIAEALLAEGAEVIGLDRQAGAGAFPILSCNLAEESEIIASVKQAIEMMDGLDILVNNAGILEEMPLASITSDHVDRMFAVNVRGAILVAREALASLPEGGRIINIASELAFLGRGEASIYCATKTAILGLTRSWARELAPRILVNAVAPGPVDTPLLAFEQMTDAQKAAEIDNPLGRIGQPREVAAAVVFLAGPGATFFTGQCLGANGGAAMN
jgi:3-oxoacyl-[acyl-carrier protein] reductase